MSHDLPKVTLPVPSSALTARLTIHGPLAAVSPVGVAKHHRLNRSQSQHPLPQPSRSQAGDLSVLPVTSPLSPRVPSVWKSWCFPLQSTLRILPLPTPSAFTPGGPHPSVSHITHFHNSGTSQSKCLCPCCRHTPARLACPLPAPLPALCSPCTCPPQGLCTCYAWLPGLSSSRLLHGSPSHGPGALLQCHFTY